MSIEVEFRAVNSTLTVASMERAISYIAEAAKNPVHLTLNAIGVVLLTPPVDHEAYMAL